VGLELALPPPARLEGFDLVADFGKPEPISSRRVFQVCTHDEHRGTALVHDSQVDFEMQRLASPERRD
jgi:hypothetical protein